MTTPLGQIHCKSAPICTPVLDREELDEINEELETGPLIRTPVLDREELDESNEELETGPLIRTPVFPEIGAR